MGVVTTSDTKYEEALTHLSEARKAFEECIDKDTWGSSDWKNGFKEKVIDVIHELRKLELRFD